MEIDLEQIIIIAGHYGTGKTNLAVNMAADFATAGEPVSLIDLDIVNPYFRSADFLSVAEQFGFELVAPPYANSNLDMPVLTAAVDAKLGSGQRLIIDVGGDDAGAIALGRYAPRIVEQGYSMLYIINGYRFLTQQPSDAVAFLQDIQRVSRLKATHVVNNSNLSYETTQAQVEDSLAFAKQTADDLGLPLLFTAVNRKIIENFPKGEHVYPIDIFVKTPW